MERRKEGEGGIPKQKKSPRCPEKHKRKLIVHVVSRSRQDKVRIGVVLWGTAVEGHSTTTAGDGGMITPPLPLPLPSFLPSPPEVFGVEERKGTWGGGK